MDGWMEQDDKDGWMNEWGRMTRTERECVPSENVAKTRHQTIQTFPYYTASIDLITDSLSLLRCSFIVMYKNNKNFFDLSHSQSNHLTPVTRENCAISMQ